MIGLMRTSSISGTYKYSSFVGDDGVVLEVMAAAPMFNMFPPKIRDLGRSGLDDLCCSGRALLITFNKHHHLSF